MKRLVFALTILIFTGIAVNAQDYNTGIGIRGGLSNGLTVKHFIGENTAIEGILATHRRGFNVTGLYQIHNQAFETPRLNWYYGFGGHIGFWNEHRNHPLFHYDTGSYTVIGIDGILGIEYNIEPIPFNISLDWKPAFNFIGYTGFWGGEVAISVRYIF
jgi:hypothetical protein